MSSIFSFQTQLVSIMDALSKTAVMEISKLVDIESKMLKIEITRGRNEVASLTEKLLLMEKLLHMAQGSRQGAPAAECSVARGGSGEGAFDPDRARHSSLRASESPWENMTCSFRPSEENVASAQLQPTEHREFIVVKEEPSELDRGGTERDRSGENSECSPPPPRTSHKTQIQEGRDEVTDERRSPEVMHHPNAITEHQQPLFPDSFVILSTQSPLIEPGRSETRWNPQITPSLTDPEAGKSFAQNAASQRPSAPRTMKLHDLRNSATKRFGCLQCGKSFRCLSQLEIHQRSHTGEKPFRCTLCGKRYAQKGHLYTHQRTHTGEKPYRCPICGKGFIQKCTLDMHQRTHTGEKPFVCVKCGKGFTKNCNLKKHLAVHPNPSLNMYVSESNAPTFSGTSINTTT